MLDKIPTNVVDAVSIQTRDRRTWQEKDTPEILEQQIIEEGKELEEAIQEAIIGKDPIHVAAEVGDVLYLTIKRKLISPDEISEEAMKAIDLAVETYTTTGLSPIDCVRMKIWRNDMKYLHHLSNNGYSYEESREVSKRQWQIFGGDEHFYQAWEEITTQILDSL